MNGWNERVSGFLISPNIWSRDYPKEAFFSSASRQKTLSPKIFDEWKTMTSTESLFQMARLPRGCICTLIKNLNPVICCWGSSQSECRKKCTMLGLREKSGKFHCCLYLKQHYSQFSRLLAGKNVILLHDMPFLQKLRRNLRVFFCVRLWSGLG